MGTTKKRWPLVVGILLGLAGMAVAVMAGLAVAGTLFFRERVAVTHDTAEPAAQRAFEAQRAKFSDLRPLLVMGADRRPAYGPGHDTRQAPGRISDLHVLVWDADQHDLVTLTVPMWLLRLKPGPIAFGEFAEFDDGGIRLDTKDLDRHGPGVVLDFATPAGDRVLLTAQ